MKKLLLTFLILFSFYFSKAQSAVYHPLPSDSLVWLESYQGSDGYYYYYIKEMVGDTSIGSYNYKKYYQSGLWSSPFYNPPVPLSYMGAIRQDIPAKRIYKMDPSGVETLLYDFNKVVGDTLAFIQFPPMADTLYVQSIDSILIGTEYHKQFNVTNAAGMAVPSPWVEGVGNLAGFGNYYTYGFEFGYNLMCFSYDNVQQYPVVGVMPGGPYCYISVGLVEITKDNFKVTVMPNPTSDAFHLNIGCKENYSVEITNASGQRLVQKNDQTAVELTFDVSAYPAGTYFIKLSDAKGNSVVKKVVKE